MSRLAKKPIQLPSGVTANFSEGCITIQGPKGSLKQPVASSVQVVIEGNAVTLSSSATERADYAQWGLTWALIKSMLKGVTTGFTKTLEIQGVGYRSEISGTKLTLSVGFSHKVIMDIPADVTLTQDAQNANTLIVTGVDAQRVGEFAGKIRAVKTPEPYKGKGIRYTNEYVRRKAGKTGAK